MSTPDVPAKPTRSELEMLRLLWRLSRAPACQVHAAAVETWPDIVYANVLRLLQMLHAKGLLIRDKSVRAHVYALAQPQDRHQASLVKDLIHKAFSGSGKELVAALLGHVSKKEREEIQQILNGGKRGE